jgi:universal stress protein A
MTYKKILVSADLVHVEKSFVANKAAELNEFYQAEMHLIHVVERFYSYGSPPFPADINEWQNEFVKAAEKKLNKLGNFIGVPLGNQHVVIGNPKELIIETAEKIGAELIILGSHSRKGISYMILGSTADGVVRAADCDVWVVRITPES